jgi:uncharacterized protein
MVEIRSRADVATEKPVPYMRQLCKHFGHRTESSFDDESGYIQFVFGRCELHARDGTLVLEVSAPDPDSHERLERVVGSHLERFGRRDGLAVEWRPERGEG